MNCRREMKLTEVTVSDKLEGFRASKEVLASDETFCLLLYITIRSLVVMVVV